MSDDQLDAAIDDALDDLSRLKPFVSYEVISLVPKQNEYSIPEDTFSVLDVLFPVMSQAVDLEAGFGSTFHSHSLSTILPIS